jgi:hypothetical protein
MTTLAGLPERMDAQAELTTLRWVAIHLLDEHARLASPHACLCPVCKAAREWVEPHQAVPHPPITPRCPLMAARPQDGG